MRVPQADVADCVFAEAAIVIERRKRIGNEVELVHRQRQEGLIAHKAALRADLLAEIPPAFEHAPHRRRELEENDARIVHDLVGGGDADLSHDLAKAEKFAEIVVGGRRHRDTVPLRLGETEAHIAGDAGVGVEKEERLVSRRKKIDQA
jgi:hypothetical protein